MNFRKRQNSIEALKDDIGIWHNDRSEIEIILVTHLRKISISKHPQHDPELLQLIQPCITDEDNELFLQVPTKDEFKGVFFQIPAWKAPGADGFQDGFCQHSRKTIATHLVDMIQGFFKTKHLLKQLSHTFQTLIPKNDCPQSPVDYRPISLCNLSYKIISKLMANRLKPILNRIISPTQSAFVSGRCINDNIIIAHEKIDTMRRSKLEKHSLAIKLDT